MHETADAEEVARAARGTRSLRGPLALAGTLALGCGAVVEQSPDFADDAGTGGTHGVEDPAGETTAAGPDGATSETTDAGDGTSTDGVDPTLLDVGGRGRGRSQCTLSDDSLSGRAACDTDAPPGSFDVALQWAWEGEAGARESVVTPLVINLTDDDDSGTIDLCDTPDIIAVAYDAPRGQQASYDGQLTVLDGATGAVHFVGDQTVNALVTPATGDIDGDGLPEIVTMILHPDEYGRLVAFDHQGATQWVSTFGVSGRQGGVALADLDADGDVEILLQRHVFNHEGALLWSANTEQQGIPVPVAVDLDDDGDLEVLHGATAWHHDGTEYFAHPEINATSTPQVADVDSDGLPEVVVVSVDGLAIVEHDGTLTIAQALPGVAGVQPMAIHDIDGIDGVPELLVGAGDAYSAVTVGLSVQWTAPVSDATGYAASTAFDFLGDGTAEAIHADQDTLRVFDALGQTLLSAPRASWTANEGPVVADVDNDGSAEIVVVSNQGYDDAVQPPIQVFRDADDRWVPARRIWNQHGYHVTNVREDGTIPQVQPKHWETLNTFRTQSQILPSGEVCRPEG
ncbi:MAG: VCBS repeat-containing protein [Myxococcota bacterium]